MNQLFFPLFVLFSELLKPNCDAKMALIKFPNQMLRDRIDASRSVPALEELHQSTHGDIVRMRLLQ